AIERTTLIALYARDHLYQVLATVGLILFFNEVARILWGSSAIYMRAPQGFTAAINLVGIPYPSYRFLVIMVGLAVAAGLYVLIHHTRVGMLTRAGAANLRMVSVLGVNVRLLNTVLFGLGAGLAGLAGLLAAPILAVQPGMGDNVIITVLVIIVVGGIGSIRGAFFGALIVGLVDTIGRVYLPILLSQVMERNMADAAGSALAPMPVFLFLAPGFAVQPHGPLPLVPVGMAL